MKGLCTDNRKLIAPSFTIEALTKTLCRRSEWEMLVKPIYRQIIPKISICTGVI